MSGHSKWANIKHKKGRQDAIKGQIYTKMAKLIAVAAREGGPDPAGNAKLKEAVAKAKAQNMPSDNIDRAIKKGAGELGDKIFEEITYEGYGIGGVAVIVETLTDNKNRTAGDVRYIFDKNGGNLGTTGCVSFMFDKKGTVLFEKDAASDEETLMDMVLEAGAEDFESSADGYEITTAPEDFYKVLDAFSASGLKPASAEVAMIPQMETELTDEEQVKKFTRMLDMFDDNDDVQAVWHNGILPEEDEEE
jgi:YebC/PmpR family DNA-binding regulatory protein